MFCRSENSTEYPLFLKIDLSPMCNLHCTCCIHAGKVGDGGLLDQQHFHSKQRMSLNNYKEIIDEVRGKTTSIVLHYLGEPYMYSEIDEAARYAYDAGIRVHIGSNFSFSFTDERIDSILNSGVTDLTVCVDGLTQELYEKTRVGGKIDRVLHNLERLCKRRKELNIKHLHIEVQYIRFEHNKHEENSICNMVFQFGVDQFSSFNGNTGNWVNRDPSSEFYQYKETKPKRSLGLLPYCYRPYI
jgi:molybdenum cofactor biosynthesis enzyme MoaA